MREEYDPNDFANNEKLFVEEQRRADMYEPQTPHDNRSDNQTHSSLTPEEMEERGIHRVYPDDDQGGDSTKKCDD